MIINNDVKYVQGLKNLWKNVFKDDNSYIDIFFNKAYKTSKCFVVKNDDNIISSLYLLECKIKFNSETFNGLYLYAAATDIKFRAKGLMSTLIEEAKLYALNNKYDFICLVPANDKLYTYYQKFGFETAMYKIVSVFDQNSSCILNGENISFTQYKKIRESLKINHFYWQNDEFDYAMSCLAHYNILPYSNEKFSFICDCESMVINEIIPITLDPTFTINGLTLNSAFEFANAKNVKHKFGMIYGINKKLQRKWKFDDIYMNFALD